MRVWGRVEGLGFRVAFAAVVPSRRSVRSL